MLPYETISEALLDSAEQVGLNIWQSDEQLDPQTLTRSFSLRCLPPGELLPRASSIQAQLSFKWDAAMTAISTLGTEAICEKYHGPNAACGHMAAGCAYETSLVLEISYTLPVSLSVGDDLQAVARLGQGIREIQRALVDHRNWVTVDANVRLESSEVRLTSVKAQQRWMIGSPIHELSELEDVFEEACSEARDMLLGLQERFGHTPLLESEDLLSLPLDIDLSDDDRIYLRPPTA
jgi:hypothetical protein